MELVFELFKIWNFEVSKSEKNIDVYSNVLYSTAKYQNDIVCIRPYTKRLILSNIKNFEFFTVHHLRSENLTFLRSLKYVIIRVDFLHTCRVHNYLHPRFFKVQNYGLQGAGPPYWRSLKSKATVCGKKALRMIGSPESKLLTRSINMPKQKRGIISKLPLLKIKALVKTNYERENYLSYIL
jgi:hypothetical protein